MENKELIDPTEIHLDLRRDYSKSLYPKFKDLILGFLPLGVNESIFGANMSIKCIQKDEGYSLFYWNHFQKNEKHFIEVNYKDEVKFFYKEEGELEREIESINIISDRYILTNKGAVELSIKEMFNYYTSLYYLYGWLKQLKR